MKRKRYRARSTMRRRSARPAAVRAPNGYPIGFEAGYQEGLRSGKDGFGKLFDGTSIIIPSYNQVDYLKQCIDSINENTGPSYEIIVVDNASQDGTADYLRSVGSRVRSRILETNRGFAGAVNVGMMMAKGTTLLLLNNDTIVTERWLDNLLLCLTSDPKIGMVGPVTNYISGSQRIEVPYKKIQDMPDFASRFNVSDPSKWQQTDRLTGFCLLFRRELRDLTGYFDEGYAVGNFEDDDYNIRVRMQGCSLVIARDTFIHHYGSISIKALGGHISEVNEHNQQFFMEKWGNPHELVHKAKEMIRLRAGETDNALPLPMGETSFFPEGIVATGFHGRLYWIEDGVRRPIAGDTNLPAVRLSQTDMRRWRLGEPIAAEEALARWQGNIPEGAGGFTAVGPGNAMYVIEKGRRRRPASRAVLERWGLHLKPASPLTAEQVGQLEEGLPIIAPALVNERL